MLLLSSFTFHGHVVTYFGSIKKKKIHPLSYKIKLDKNLPSKQDTNH